MLTSNSSMHPPAGGVILVAAPATAAASAGAPAAALAAASTTAAGAFATSIAICSSGAACEAPATHVTLGSKVLLVAQLAGVATPFCWRRQT